MLNITKPPFWKKYPRFQLTEQDNILTLSDGQNSTSVDLPTLPASIINLTASEIIAGTIDLQSESNIVIEIDLEQEPTIDLDTIVNPVVGGIYTIRLYNADDPQTIVETGTLFLDAAGSPAGSVIVTTQLLFTFYYNGTEFYSNLTP